MSAHADVLIVGSGFSGLGAAIQLKQAGIDDFTVLERAEEVGGTWRDNTYPGAACDVPSNLYSFSFAPNPGWSRSFSDQSEILAYLRRCAEQFAITPHIRFGHTVQAAAWDEDRQVWAVDTDRGRFTGRFLVLGVGALSEPSIPAIPGLERFAGTTFHSARWDHDHDLRGRRVAVIGTGASAIQFVPQIQPEVAQLDLYQRTPAWVIPRHDRDVTRLERWAYRRFPRLQRLVRTAVYWGRELYVVGFTRSQMSLPERIARRHLSTQVPDPDLRAKLTPDYTIGCKRILLANDFYPAVSQPDVEVVTSGIREVTPTSIVCTDGTERPADTIIFGTGFKVTEFPASRYVRGRDGQVLRDAWQDGMEAHLGSTVAGFPNLFLLTGPNTGLGHSSMVLMIESQVAYLVDCLRWMNRAGVATVEVRPEAQRAFNVAVQEKMRGTVWTSGGCASWYLDEAGRNRTLWPDYTWRFRWRTRRFDPASYRVELRHPNHRSPVSVQPTTPNRDAVST